MTTSILVLLGGAGVVQGLFTSIYFVTTTLRKQASNLLLLGLNLFVLIFLVNTIYLYASAGREIRLFSNVSMSALILLGPLALFYTRTFLDKSHRFAPIGVLHVVPAALPLLFGFGFCKLHMGYVGAYVFLYLLFSFFAVRKTDTVFKRKVWIYFMLGGLSLLIALVTFFSVGWLCIISISIGFTAISYTGTYIGIQLYKDVFDQREESSMSQLSIENSPELFTSIDRQVRSEKLYRDPGMTLPGAARKLKIHANKLSFIINKESGMGFSDYINSFRIAEAKQMLTSSNSKVATVAFDCGFNSLSTFYSVFKKHVGCSPTDFRGRTAGKNI